MNELKSAPVQNNEDAGRFEAQVGDEIAFLAYRRTPETLHLVHTVVPTALEGQGLGSALARSALDFARGAKLQVVPSCGFVSGFIRRRSEYADLVQQK